MISVRRSTFYIFFIAFVLVVLYFNVRILRDGDLAGACDYKVYYLAGERMSVGDELYQDKDLPMVHKYCPAYAMMMIPLAKLDLAVSVLVWYILNLVFLFLVFILAMKLVRFQSRKERILTCILTLLLCIKAIMGNFQLGQTNILILLLFMLCLYGFVRRNHILAGVAFGTLIMIKLTPLLFVLYFFYHKRYRSVLYACLTIVVLFLLPLFIWNFKETLQSHIHWILMLKKSTPELLFHYKNQSVISFIIRHLGIGPQQNSAILGAQVLTFILLAFFTAVTLFLCRPRKGTSRETQDAVTSVEFSMLLVIMVLFSPLAWGATLIQMFPAYFLVSYYWVKGRFKDPVLGVLVIFSFITSTATSPDLLGETLAKWIQVNIGKTFSATCIFTALIWVVTKLKQGEAVSS